MKDTLKAMRKEKSNSILRGRKFSFRGGDSDWFFNNYVVIGNIFIIFTWCVIVSVNLWENIDHTDQASPKRSYQLKSDIFHPTDKVEVYK